jgi:hypothetical protein
LNGARFRQRRKVLFVLCKWRDRSL